MNYKRLTKCQEEELINVLCGDYDLKATLKHIDNLMNHAYNEGRDEGYEVGYDMGRDVLY